MFLALQQSHIVMWPTCWRTSKKKRYKIFCCCCETMTQFLAPILLFGIQTTVAITLYQTLLPDIFRKLIIFVDCCCRYTCNFKSTTALRKAYSGTDCLPFCKEKIKSNRMKMKEINSTEHSWAT